MAEPSPEPPTETAAKPPVRESRWEGTPEEGTLQEQLTAMGEEIQGRGEASGDVEADLLASGTVHERPAFQPPSGSSTVIQANPQAPGQLPAMPNLKGMTPSRLRSIQQTFNALMEHVMRARERFNEEGFTPNQTGMIMRAPTETARNVIRAREYGNRIDAMVKESISGDRRLDGLGVSERYQRGPDFFDPLNDVWYDITTLRSWAQHVRDYGFSGWGVHAPSGR
jgi:hypothetical protein